MTNLGWEVDERREEGMVRRRLRREEEQRLCGFTVPPLRMLMVMVML